MSTPMNRPRNPKAASDIDALVGAKIKRHRLERGISQTELAAASGITFQQVQKYEKGKNRVSVARLAEIASTLGVPLASFVQDLPDLSDTRRAPAAVSVLDQFLATEEGVALVRAFTTIDDAAVRRGLVSLIGAVAQATIRR